MTDKPMMACPVCRTHSKPLPHCKCCGGAGKILDIYKMGPELTPDGKYCAPWCGRGCTKKEHDRAHEKATALAERMGAGWTTRVWENLGWHYSVQSPCGRLRVSPPYLKNPGPFTAYLGDPGAVGGRWSAHHRDPHRAVELVVAQAKEELVALRASLEGL